MNIIHLLSKDDLMNNEIKSPHLKESVRNLMENT